VQHASNRSDAIEDQIDARMSPPERRLQRLQEEIAVLEAQYKMVQAYGEPEVTPLARLDGLRSHEPELLERLLKLKTKALALTRVCLLGTDERAGTSQLAWARYSLALSYAQMGLWHQVEVHASAALKLLEQREEKAEVGKWSYQFNKAVRDGEEHVISFRSEEHSTDDPARLLVWERESRRVEKQNYILAFCFRIFHKMDIDGNGSIGKEEMLRVMTSDLEVAEFLQTDSRFSQFSSKDYETLFDSIDENKSGDIDWQEFVASFFWEQINRAADCTCEGGHSASSSHKRLSYNITIGDLSSETVPLRPLLELLLARCMLHAVQGDAYLPVRTPEAGEAQRQDGKEGGGRAAVAKVRRPDWCPSSRCSDGLCPGGAGVCNCRNATTDAKEMHRQQRLRELKLIERKVRRAMGAHFDALRRKRSKPQHKPSQRTQPPQKRQAPPKRRNASGGGATLEEGLLGAEEEEDDEQGGGEEEEGGEEEGGGEEEEAEEEKEEAEQDVCWWAWSDVSCCQFYSAMVQVLLAQYKLLASAARASATERASCWLSSTEEGARELREMTARINRRGLSGAEADRGGNRDEDEDEDERGWEGSIRRNKLNPEQRREAKRNARARARVMLMEKRRAHYLTHDPQQAGARKRGSEVARLAFEYLVRVWTIKEAVEGQGRYHLDVGCSYHAIGRMVMAAQSVQTSNQGNQGIPRAGGDDPDARAAQYLTIASGIYQRCLHLPMLMGGEAMEKWVAADDAPVLAAVRAQLGALELRRARSKGKGKGAPRSYTAPPVDMLEPKEAEAAIESLEGAARYLTKVCTEREAVGGLGAVAEGGEGMLVAQRAVRMWEQIAATHEQLAAQGAGGARQYRTKPEEQQQHRAKAVEAYASMVEAARAGHGAGSMAVAKASKRFGDACMRLGPATSAEWAASFDPAQQAYRAHLQSARVLCSHHGRYDSRYVGACAKAKQAKRDLAKDARNNQQGGGGEDGTEDGDAEDLEGSTLDLAWLD
jgi:hypothetical protein